MKKIYPLVTGIFTLIIMLVLNTFCIGCSSSENDVETNLVANKHFVYVNSSENSFDISVNSNVDFNVIIPSENDWITLVKSDEDNNAFTFHADTNDENETRQGLILFVAKNVTDSVKIFQNGSRILYVNNNSFTIGAEGGVIDIELTSNIDYSIEIPDVDWVTTSETRGSITEKLRFNVDANDTYDEREATIIIKDNNSKKQEEILIIQEKQLLLQIDRTTIEDDGNGKTYTINVEANVYYRVEIPESCQWVSRIETRGVESSWIKFNVEENNTLEKRNVEIAIVCDRYPQLNKIITINQKIGGVKITEDELISMYIGETYAVKYKLPENLTENDLKWESTDTSVATISDSGVIQAVGSGSATIKVTDKNGHTSICYVRIKNIANFIDGNNGLSYMATSTGYGSYITSTIKNNTNENYGCRSIFLKKVDVYNYSQSSIIDSEYLNETLESGKEKTVYMKKRDSGYCFVWTYTFADKEYKYTNRYRQE